MVVTTKRKIKSKNKESRSEVISNQMMGSHKIEMQNFDTVELDVKKYDAYKQYDTEGQDNLLGTERNKFDHDEINIEINQEK